MIINRELSEREKLTIVSSMKFSILSSDQIDALMGRNLRRIREAKGWTQEQMATCIQVAAPRISAYESGKEGMGKDVMARLCRALNMQPWEFYVTEETPIIRDEKEKEALSAIREAERLHVSEDIARYGRFRIEEAKRQAAGSVDERLTRGRAILRKRRQKKKTA